MELMDAIENRKSIRKFKDKQVSKEIIEDLINCARLAPSAKNRQPWKFVVVNEKIKSEIIRILIEKEKELDVKNSIKTTVEVMRQAPILILVLKNKENYWKTGDTLSIGAAIEHICLRATDLGLGSLWVRDTVYAEKEIKKLIPVGEKELICAVLIGYPQENPGRRPRKDLDEILEWMEEK